MSAAGLPRERSYGSREVVIRPPSALQRLDLRDYYAHRHLFRALVRRNVQLQFSEMRFGVVWAFVRPLLYVAVFAAFRSLSDADTHVSIPYALYIYSGLILWYYILDTVMATASALRKDADLLTKIYYPRLITPAVPVVANLVPLGLAAVPLLVMMLVYRVGPDWSLVLLPLVLFQVMGLCLGVGTVFAALSLTARDWERFLSTALYLGLFVSPVIYAPDMIPQEVRSLYLLNPAAGSLMAFRASLFSPVEFPVALWAYSVAVSGAICVLGLRLFRVAEFQIADRL
jgi:lipopolysaccharide transport system permease protein